MPIQVDYGGATAPAIGGAGYTAGLGDFSRWLAEYQQRQQQMAQQAALQAASLQQQAQSHQDSVAANVYGQQLGYLGDMSRLAAAGQQRLQGQQFDAQKTQYEQQQIAQRQQSLFDQQAARDEEIAKRQQAHDERLSGAADQRQFMHDSAQQFNEQLNWADQAVTNQTHYYNPTQEIQMQKLLSDMTATAADTGTTDSEKQIALASLQRQYNLQRANPTPYLPGKRPKAWAEQAQEGMVTMPIKSPDGTSILGHAVVTPQVRNGQTVPHIEQFIPLVDPKQSASQRDFFEGLAKSGRKVKDADGIDQSVPYTPLEMAELWNSIQGATALATAPEKMQQAKDQFQQQQTAAAQQQQAAMIQQRYEQLKAVSPPVAEQFAQAYGLNQQPPQAVPQQAEQTPPPVPQQPPPGQRIAPAAPGAQLAEQAIPKTIAIGGIQAPEGTTKKHAEAVNSLLPHPKTPDEASLLRPGTRFIGPDGTIWKVPMPSQ